MRGAYVRGPQGRRSFNLQSYYHHRRFARQPTNIKGNRQTPSADDSSSQFRWSARKKRTGGHEQRKQTLFGTVQLSCFSVSTLLATALDAAANLFADFFKEKRGAAGWTGLVDRTIPQGIFARGILTARKERTSFSRALLDEVASTA